MVLADELAKQQRSISVAEFFEKNKHLLGFDSPTRGVITTIKEAVDNALDACEEAQVLPDIFISIKKTGTDIFGSSWRTMVLASDRNRCRTCLWEAPLRLAVPPDPADPRPAGYRHLGSSPLCPG